MKIRSITAALLAVLCFFTPAFAITKANADVLSPAFTNDELQYISEHPEIRVCVIAGIAPIAYFKNGEMYGITRGVLDKIQERTGFIFKCTESTGTAAAKALVHNGDVDLLAAIPKQYIGDDLASYPVSKPFLESETVLFIRNGVDASDLPNKVFAAVAGGNLPEGVNADNVKYYNGREETLNAIEAGDADYCYANEFSIAYYTTKNDYKNVLTIPRGVEARAYMFLYANTDEEFISIINKALDSISSAEMQHIILEGSTNVERKLSFSLVMYSYGTQITVIALIIIFLLMFLMIMAVYSNRQSQKQLRRYMLLSDMSDEFIYEYDISKDRLSLTTKCSELLGAPNSISNYKKNGGSALIMSDGLDIIDGETREVTIKESGDFRMVNSVVLDAHGRPEYIIGKLINISEEKEKLRELAIKAETDGLTGLYNAVTARSLMKKRRMNSVAPSAALFIIDIDNFKVINDRFGHYMGDRALICLATALREVFRENDVIGRVGGDEFCAYMDGNITETIVKERYEALRRKLKSIQESGDYPAITVSAGILLGNHPNISFKEAYEKADGLLS